MRIAAKGQIRVDAVMCIVQIILSILIAVKGVIELHVHIVPEYARITRRMIEQIEFLLQVCDG